MKGLRKTEEQGRAAARDGGKEGWNYTWASEKHQRLFI